jgi:hypothetical protein
MPEQLLHAHSPGTAYVSQASLLANEDASDVLDRYLAALPVMSLTPVAPLG